MNRLIFLNTQSSATTDAIWDGFGDLDGLLVVLLGANAVNGSSSALFDSLASVSGTHRWASSVVVYASVGHHVLVWVDPDELLDDSIDRGRIPVVPSWDVLAVKKRRTHGLLWLFSGRRCINHFLWLHQELIQLCSICYAHHRVRVPSDGQPLELLDCAASAKNQMLLLLSSSSGLLGGEEFIGSRRVVLSCDHHLLFNRLLPLVVTVDH